MFHLKMFNLMMFNFKMFHLMMFNLVMFHLKMFNLRLNLKMFRLRHNLMMPPLVTGLLLIAMRQHRHPKWIGRSLTSRNRKSRPWMNPAFKCNYWPAASDRLCHGFVILPEVNIIS
jgi:hypothetical protein